ncbi:MAG: DUF433 domain-containing protein [Acidobacteria bacterium]|nr:DUF433 domain-containing protein [Acidobacteriota bacterium]
MNDDGVVVSNPKVMLGKPVIRGTRITVELILEEFAAGQTEADILLAYPHLTQEGVRAALTFAAKEARLPMQRRALPCGGE